MINVTLSFFTVLEIMYLWPGQLGGLKWLLLLNFYMAVSLRSCAVGFTMNGPK